MTSNFHNSLFLVTKNKCLLKLWHFLKHNYFIIKLVKHIYKLKILLTFDYLQMNKGWGKNNLSFRTKLKDYPIFTKVLIFFWVNHNQNSSYSFFFLPLLNLLGWVMHLCKFAYVDLTWSYLRHLQTLSFVAAYWYAFKKMFKTSPWQMFFKPKYSQLNSSTILREG
jgi:hypothetical protein